MDLTLKDTIALNDKMEKVVKPIVQKTYDRQVEMLKEINGLVEVQNIIKIEFFKRFPL